MLSFEFQQFYDSWMRKAEEYIGEDVRNCFDKFFTLYVVYNRLYAEVTFKMARDKKINLENLHFFPDRKAAVDYVVQFSGDRDLIENLESNIETEWALKKIKFLLAENCFNIVLDIKNGEPNKEEDQKLLDGLNSNSNSKKATSITKTIYQVRCNLFHGHKEFIGVQKEIMVPINILLRKIIDVLYKKLQQNN